MAVQEIKHCGIILEVELRNLLMDSVLGVREGFELRMTTKILSWELAGGADTGREIGS